MVRVARMIHVLSATWVLILGAMILVDVFGRVLFLQPLEGTKEILQNSVIAVTFLQIPLAIFTGSMLKTSMLVDVLPPVAQRLLRTFAFVLGAALFAAIAYASWQPALDAVRLGEYEGEGALRIYTWPIRFLLVGTCVFAAIAYATMIIEDWRGALGQDGGLLGEDPS